MVTVDFSAQDGYNQKANYKNIKFGAKAPMLEVELNELQKIFDGRLRDSLKTLFGDGLVKIGSFSQAGNVLTLANSVAIVNGVLVTITSIATSLTAGDKIYLDVWEEEVTFSSTIKENGNNQTATNVPNKIKDSRVGEETSRRVQYKFDFSKTNADPTHSYVLLGTVDTQGSFSVAPSTNQSFDRMQAYIDTQITSARAYTDSKASTAETNAINFAKGYGLGSGLKSMANDYDLRTLNATGFYRVALTTAQDGLPSGTYTLLNQYHSSPFTSQIAIGINGGSLGKVYTRTMNGGTWSPWLITETTAGSQAKIDALAKSTKDYTDAQVANLVSSAPDLLNTLDELAQALGDDPNFATTMTSKLAEKESITNVDSKVAQAVSTASNDATSKANTAEANAKNASVSKTGDSDVTGKLTAKAFTNKGGFKTTNTGSTFVNQWTKVASVRLDSQGASAIGTLRFESGVNASTSPIFATIHYRVKQQNAMAGAPTIALVVLENNVLMKTHFKFVTTQNDATATVVDLYFNMPVSNDVMMLYPLTEGVSGGNVSYFEAQPYSPSLPTGTQNNARYQDAKLNSLSVENSATINGVDIETTTGAGQKVSDHEAKASIHVTQALQDKWNAGQLKALTTAIGSALIITDFNNVTSTGFYRTNGVVPNNPTGSTASVYYHVFAISYSSELVMQAHNVVTGDIYYRKYVPANGWSAWKQFESADASQAKADKALKDAKDYAVPASSVGQPNGIAPLGTDGKVAQEYLNVAPPKDASQTEKGIVKLEDSVESTSTTTASTPNSVKKAFDKAVSAEQNAKDFALPKQGGTATGDIKIKKDIAKLTLETLDGTKTIEILHNANATSDYGLNIKVNGATILTVQGDGKVLNKDGIELDTTTGVANKIKAPTGTVNFNTNNARLVIPVGADKFATS